jgi:hypothetical protein
LYLVLRSQLPRVFLNGILFILSPSRSFELDCGEQNQLFDAFRFTVWAGGR